MLVFLGVLVGCASNPGTANRSAATSKLTGSSLEINYMRGGNLHRFIATLNGDLVQAECYRDRQLLRSRHMDPAKYQELVKLATQLLEQSPTPALAACRAPFTLRLRNDEAVKTMDGCRSSEQGVALGKLIKDAEFLVFSEN